MKHTVLLVVAALLVAAGAGASFALGGNPHGDPPGQDPCSHGATGKDCRPDPQPDHGKDCDHHGQNGGVNEDHCLPETTPTDTTPTDTTPTTTTPTTPTDTTPTTPTTPFVCPDGHPPEQNPVDPNDNCKRPVPPAVTPPVTSTPPVTTTTTVTTAPPTTTTAPPVIQPKPKPKPIVKPKAPAKHKTPVKTPNKPKKVTPPTKHVCLPLADGTRRAWYKGGNGMPAGCYAIIQGSG